jgi:hypothetical protein
MPESQQFAIWASVVWGTLQPQDTSETQKMYLESRATETRDAEVPSGYAPSNQYTIN